MTEASKKFYENHALIRIKKCCYEKLKGLRTNPKEGMVDVVARLLKCDHTEKETQVQ